MRKLILLTLAFCFILTGLSYATMDLEKIEGYIPGLYRDESFTVDCSKKMQYVEFTYPSYADFWVKVLGMDGDLLGDFQLSNGEVISLKGGGRFTLVVSSKKGTGAWTAVPVPEDQEHLYE